MHWEFSNRFQKEIKLFKKNKDIKSLERIKQLMIDIEKNGLECCLGKLEKLKHQLTGMYSRRINKKDRLVYKLENNSILLISCKDHY